MKCICNACANDSPCIIDGGEGSGEPLYCPYCGSLYDIAEWTEIEDVSSSRVGPTLDEEIEDLENEGFVVFAPGRKIGWNSVEEAIDSLLDLGYTITAPEE